MSTFKYTALQQSVPSDDEDGLGEDVDDVLFDRKEADRRQKKPIIDLNLAGWSNEESPSVKFQGQARKTCLLLSVLLVILGGSAAAIVLPIITQRGTVVAAPKASPDWSYRMNETATESCMQVVDVDGDGLDDVLVGATSVGLMQKVMNTVAKNKTMPQACAAQGKSYPCAAKLIAFRGYDGKKLWEAKLRSNAIFINCREVDINRDGQPDCIVSGRLSTLQAIDPKTGKTLWASKPDMKPWNSVFSPIWNNYQAKALPDFTGDGIPEVLIAHGGNPRIDAKDPNRESGRLIILSGATGKPIGPGYLSMPDEKETYMSPVFYTAKDGSVYVLFGSGGETVPGNFYAVSLPDLYKSVQKSHGPVNVVPGVNVTGRYKNWQDKRNASTGLITIYKGQRKGVMVPPVIVDVTFDGVDDILMSAYDGVLILYDGTDLHEIWRQEFPGMESYSSPAPAYFDDDDVLDFMMHWSRGEWPRYDRIVHVVISGKDGSILWQVASSRNDMASDLVLRTTIPHQDAYVFPIRGRVGGGRSGLGRKETHGLLGNSHTSNPPSTAPPTTTTPPPTTTTPPPTTPPTLPPKEKPRSVEGFVYTLNKTDDPFYKNSPEDAAKQCKEIREDYEKFHTECSATDLDIEMEEIFLMDRRLAAAPIKLLETKAERLDYEMSHKEGENHCHPLDPATGNIKMCIVVVPDVQTTAAIADVDGDGQPDLLKVAAEVGSLVSDLYSSFSMADFLVVRKVNMAAAIARHETVPFNISSGSPAIPTTPSKGVHDFTFLPMARQRWTSYLSSLPFSTYREP